MSSDHTFNVAQAEQVRISLEKIAGHREYDPDDYSKAINYKPAEVWSTDEYLADIALKALAAQPPAAPVEPSAWHCPACEAAVVVVDDPTPAHERSSADSGGPTVVDFDDGEISVRLNGEELRGWSYSNDDERRTKMLAAREYVEGWYDGRTNNG